MWSWAPVSRDVQISLTYKGKLFILLKWGGKLKRKTLKKEGLINI